MTTDRAKLLLECIRTEVQIMQAANYARSMQNEAPAYGEKHFDDLLHRCERIAQAVSTTVRPVESKDE
jgi:hypothetical protein